MTTVHAMDKGSTAFSKGAMEKLLPLCSHIMINGERKSLDDNDRDDVIHADHALMDMGLRVLAFAIKEYLTSAREACGDEESRRSKRT